jgi:hypothetical protein
MRVFIRNGSPEPLRLRRELRGGRANSPKNNAKYGLAVRIANGSSFRRTFEVLAVACDHDRADRWRG